MNADARITFHGDYMALHNASPADAAALAAQLRQQAREMMKHYEMKHRAILAECAQVEARLPERQRAQRQQAQRIAALVGALTRVSK